MQKLQCAVLMPPNAELSGRSVIWVDVVSGGGVSDDIT